MTQHANIIAQELQAENPNMSYEQVLKTVEQEIKDTFPAKFENPARQQPSAVDGGTNREIAPKTGGKSFNDLPADAKEMCKQNVAQGLYKSKEEWVKTYFEEE
jgi:hypothetical protein